MSRKILLVCQRNFKILPTLKFFMPSRKPWCGKRTSPKIAKKSKNFKIEFERFVVGEAHLVVDWYVHVLNAKPLPLLIKSYIL